jgi:hypothetical protein
MRRTYVETDMEKREAFAEGDWAGEGQESVPDLTDATQCLKGKNGLE